MIYADDYNGNFAECIPSTANRLESKIVNRLTELKL